MGSHQCLVDETDIHFYKPATRWSFFFIMLRERNMPLRACGRSVPTIHLYRFEPHRYRACILRMFILFGYVGTISRLSYICALCCGGAVTVLTLYAYLTKWQTRVMDFTFFIILFVDKMSKHVQN